jgi:hypothetical protein
MTRRRRDTTAWNDVALPPAAMKVICIPGNSVATRTQGEHALTLCTGLTSPGLDSRRPVGAY